MEPQQDESGIDTYGVDEGDEFSGTEYELYTVLENRVKKRCWLEMNGYPLKI